MNRIVVLAILVLHFVCCAGGSETGNPFRSIPIELQVRSSDPQVAAVSEAAGGTVIEQAWFSFGIIAFIGDEQCSDPDGLNYEVGDSLVTADLADEGTVVEIDMEVGKYCGVVVPLKKWISVLPDGAPDELSDHSIVLKGKRADGISFTLAHPDHDELEIINPVSGHFSVGPTKELLLLSFDLAILMKEMELDTADLAPDGTIHIDEQNNLELLKTFKYNLECALTLYADADNNGELDSSDRLLSTCEEEEEEEEEENEFEFEFEL